MPQLRPGGLHVDKARFAIQPRLRVSHRVARLVEPRRLLAEDSACRAQAVQQVHSLPVLRIRQAARSQEHEPYRHCQLSGPTDRYAFVPRTILAPERVFVRTYVRMLTDMRGR